MSANFSIPEAMKEFRVILVEPAFEESIGFVARAMKNFGLADLRLVNPTATLSKSGRMRGGHAQDILSDLKVHQTLEESLEGVNLSIGTTAQKARSGLNLLRQSMTPKELAAVLSDTSGAVGLVFGREGTGLTNQELDLCGAVITIPTVQEYQTLNLSHAAAILFYELSSSFPEEISDELAVDEVKSVILRYLSESATITGMVNYKRDLALKALRNVLERSAIRKREASLLAGLFKEVYRKVQGQGTADVLKNVDMIA